MAQLNGSLGWIGVADEAVAYGTIGVIGDMEYLQGISAKATFNRNWIDTPTLGSDAPAIGLATSTHALLDIVTAHTNVEADLATLYGVGSASSSSVYDFADPAVDMTSLSAYFDMQGAEWDAVGCMPTKYVWNFSNSGPATLTTSFICQSMALWGGAARTEAVPPASEIVLPAGLTTFTIGGTAVAGVTGGSVTVERKLTGMERQALGTAILRQPILDGSSGPSIKITASFNCELDAALGNNTVAEIADILSATTSGAVVFSTFAIAGAQLIGDIPEAGRGLRTCTLNYNCTGLSVTTT
ncbi:MAG TPA: phage tail tube protein [Dehalococcoidia bacterium]|nr:phage tail tube protein [Dehalococcoidia bacterium]